MRELSRLSGISFQEIIRAETQSILEAASKKTQAAQVKLIEANVRNKPVRTVNGKAYLTKTGPGFAPPAGWSPSAPNGWRLPDAIWTAVQAQIKASITRRKAARGLSKKSWQQAAQSLGIDIAVPAYVAKATTPKGDYPENATGSEKTEGRGFFIEVTNSRTYSPSVVDSIRAAMRGRTNFFKKNMKLGVFQKTSEIAAKYPGLKVA